MVCPSCCRPLSPLLHFLCAILFTHTEHCLSAKLVHLLTASPSICVDVIFGFPLMGGDGASHGCRKTCRSHKKSAEWLGRISPLWALTRLDSHYRRWRQWKWWSENASTPIRKLFLSCLCRMTTVWSVWRLHQRLKVDWSCPSFKWDCTTYWGMVGKGWVNRYSRVQKCIVL